MKQFDQTDFLSREDIQIQIPTARLGFTIDLASGILLEDIRVRARIVGASFGTKTIIEKMTLQHLFEIGAQAEGFFRVSGLGNGKLRFRGTIDIARGGALELTNNTYISVDIIGVQEPDGANGILRAQIHSLQHVKSTKTFLHYNPVSINQAIQNIQLDRATEVVLPVSKIGEVQLSYLTNNVPYTQEELRYIGDYSNDLVSVTDGGAVVYGYDTLVILPVKDALSAEMATRIQVESVDSGSQYTIYLIEEKTL